VTASNGSKLGKVGVEEEDAVTIGGQALAGDLQGNWIGV
jgi:hypothetical protein